ncbi:uncharacterized protein METZ01_LOCUS199465 [marine metagenome]|uniref:Uncharacterized protein n=1 Tax=marine metagenome TaxID=408172 RepID=A0A382E9E0_9ZZZZ
MKIFQNIYHYVDRLLTKNDHPAMLRFYEKSV